MLPRLVKRINQLLAISVHLFTASGTIVALVALHYITHKQPIYALSLMILAVFIDAVDGTLARALNVKIHLPNIDGALLDNIVDYLNYVFIPVAFILEGYLALPLKVSWTIAVMIVLSSCFQFCQGDAKTKDNFFKGFPCYWNIVILYLFIFNASAFVNIIVLTGLCFLIFVPIKYIYPSRLTHLSTSSHVKNSMRVGTILFGLTTICLLVLYPKRPIVFSAYALFFTTYYLLMSLYRTWRPLNAQI